MAVDVPNRTDQQSMTSLVSGIVSDFQRLLEQQLRLTRQEVIADLRKAKEGGLLLAVGGAVCYLGAIPLLVGLALILVHAGMSPWASFVLVGALVVGVGAAVLFLGKRRLDRLAPLEETARALKENMEWTTNPK